MRLACVSTRVLGDRTVQPTRCSTRRIGMDVRSCLPLAYLAVACSVVACDQAATTSVATSSPHGALAGTARMYGGPAVDGHQAMNGDPGGGITVTVSSEGRQVASAVTHQDGLFSFDLPPGDYTVSGCTTFQVRVSADATTKHDLNCPIP
ncbi:MAG: SdrD B-like domain [Acidimicrobiaceae bacterium]|nr:SdrD B-like domain [Acidimicrobiaceae bacterium]